MTTRLYDCFTFFCELDLLELRLNEMSDVVHKFVLVESTKTFTGKDKPLYFADNKERYAAFADRIIHVVVDDMPEVEGDRSAWLREYFQRRAIMRGLNDPVHGARPGDAVLISDLDEIPRAAVVKNVLASGKWRRAITVFQSALFLYSLNLGAENGGPFRNSFNQTPRLIQRRYLRDPESLRTMKTISIKRGGGTFVTRLQDRMRAWRQQGWPLRVEFAPNGAWHFTYVGDKDAFKRKLISVAHTEFATDSHIEDSNLEKLLKERRAIYDDSIRLEVRALDDSMPAYLRTHADKFRHLLADA